MEETGTTGPLSFFTRRWRRKAPLGLMFWRDMVVVGSALNVVAAFGGLMALGFKADLIIAILIFHAPLPYNIFIVGAIWRTADLLDKAKASSARLGAAAWLVVMTVI